MLFYSMDGGTFTPINIELMYRKILRKVRSLKIETHEGVRNISLWLFFFSYRVQHIPCILFLKTYFFNTFVSFRVAGGRSYTKMHFLSDIIF